MRRLAVCISLAALAGGCGGSGDPAPAQLKDPQAGGSVDELANGTYSSPAEDASGGEGDGERRGEARRGGPAGGGSGGETAGPGDGGDGGGSPPQGGAPGAGRRYTRADVRAGDPNARALENRLDEAKAAVQRVLMLISAGNPGVCSEYFTQRYMEARTGRKGDEAVAKCRSDISRNEGEIRFKAFGPSTIEDGRRATVRLNATVGDRLLDIEYVLLRSETGRWQVDEAR